MYHTINAVAIRSATTVTARPAQHTFASIHAQGSDRVAKIYLSLPTSLRDAYQSAVGRPEFCAEAGMVSCVYGKKTDDRLFVIGLGLPGSPDSGRTGTGGRGESGGGKDAVVGGAVVGSAVVGSAVGGSAVGGARRLDALRHGAAKLARQLFVAEINQLTLILDAHALDGLNKQAVGCAIGEGLSLANLTYDRFHGTVKNNGQSQPSSPKKLTLQVDKSWLDGIRHGLCVGESTNVARELAATPPNVADPAYLVRYCKTMAKKIGLRCTIIDAKKAESLGMGGLLAVGRAGSTPPALIVLEWPGKKSTTPSNKKSKSKKQSTLTSPPPVLLVGKAITFDTGGYSIKPSASMVGMKYDKCGGTAVIGAMHAIASLKLPTRVVAIIATAENMVDAHAYRPNDIITHTNGVTVEITNTDAEGRLVLADALAYGCKTYQPRTVIDLATLTGGVVVALGSYCAGCFCADSDLRRALFDAGDVVGERLWHLPLWDEHRDMIKGTHSDLVNSAIGGHARGAHPIQGAAFLSYFATPHGNPAYIGQNKSPNGKPFRWAHLDIAGVSDVKSDTPLFNTGPTGFGVRLLAQMIKTWSD